jgi:uncharacterized protein (TIGR03000 family)
MFKATWFSLKVAALATAVVLMFADDALAQRRAWRGWSGGGGGGYGPGWYGGTYYGGTPYYYPDNAANVPMITGSQSFYPPDANVGRMNDNSAAIMVRVPADAKLTFDGKATTQTGQQRFFTTPALEPGKTFTYEVQATWTDNDGQPVTRTREVQVRANQQAQVNFMQTQSQEQNQNRNPNQNQNQIR